MISKLFLFYSLTFNVINYSSSECTVGDHTFPNGEIWLQNTYFNVTCRRGKISVLNCVTDRGTFLPVGTPPFIEEGIKYTCDPVDEPIEFLPDDFEGSGEEEISGECEDGKTEYNFAGFVVSCLTNQILGCVDSSGEIVTNGFFYLPNKVLKYCRVFGNNKKARIENKGCFNGSIHDHPSDDTYHVPKYTIWTTESGMQYRCGDDGIKVYKCPLPGKKTIHTGSAWLDEQHVLNVCH